MLNFTKGNLIVVCVVLIAIAAFIFYPQPKEEIEPENQKIESVLDRVESVIDKIKE